MPNQLSPVMEPVISNSAVPSSAQGLLQVGELDGAGVVLAVTGGDGAEIRRSPDW